MSERNNLAIYDDVADHWWSDEIRWVRTLENMVPGRLAWFDKAVDWTDQSVLDLGCAGGFMAEAMHHRGAVVTGIDPAEDAIAAARAHAASTGRKISDDVGVGEALPEFDRPCEHMSHTANPLPYTQTGAQRGDLALSKDASQHRRYHTHYEDLLN